MVPSDAGVDHQENNQVAAAQITIDPLVFFQCAADCTDLWQDLVGFSITHCTFGPGTITKIDGEYFYVDLPERPGKKQLTEFGLSAFQRGYFHNLRIDAALQEKMNAARLIQEQSPPPEAVVSDAPQASPKKKRTASKAAKKTAKS